MIVRVIKVFEGLTYFLKNRTNQCKTEGPVFFFSLFSYDCFCENQSPKGGYMNSITGLFDAYVLKEDFST